MGYAREVDALQVGPSHRAIGVQLRDQGSMSDITVRNIHLTAQWQLRTWWGAAEAIVISRLFRSHRSPPPGRLKVRYMTASPSFGVDGGLGPYMQDSYDARFSAHRNAEQGPVSYTHLTLPTNREV